MNLKNTGKMIRQSRKEKGLSQSELSERLGVTDKAVSKWETAKGLPDIALLEDISRTLDISVSELVSGKKTENTNRSADMRRTLTYICPKCHNVITSSGALELSCCGKSLSPLEAAQSSELEVSVIEENYSLAFRSPMTKEDHIVFVLALGSDFSLLTRLYPQGEPSCEVPIRKTTDVYWYSDRDGLKHIRESELRKRATCP